MHTCMHTHGHPLAHTISQGFDANCGTSEAMGWSNGPSSPSPTTKVHHERTGALPFCHSQKNFLCIKSPPSMSSQSSKLSGKLLTMTNHHTSMTTSTVSSPQSMRTMGQPSLKSRESTASVLWRVNKWRCLCCVGCRCR